MRCSFLIGAAALTSALAVGCTDQQEPPAAADPAGPALGAPIVGTGTGHFTFLVQAADFGATIIHENVQGTIDLASGGQARVFGVARVTILPDGTQLFDVERVTLTPL
jgi:hypothetical protein